MVGMGDCKDIWTYNNHTKDSPTHDHSTPYIRKYQYVGPCERCSTNSHTHRVPLQRQRYILRKGDMPSDPLRECGLRKGMDAILLQEIHLHKGGPTHANWLLPCQACPQLRSAAFPCCNTLKPTHPSVLLTQKVPPPNTRSMLLILQHDVGLVGRSDEPSKRGSSNVQDPPSTCCSHPNWPHPNTVTV